MSLRDLVAGSGCGGGSSSANPVAQLTNSLLGGSSKAASTGIPLQQGATRCLLSHVVVRCLRASSRRAQDLRLQNRFVCPPAMALCTSRGMPSLLMELRQQACQPPAYSSLPTLRRRPTPAPLRAPQDHFTQRHRSCSPSRTADHWGCFPRSTRSMLWQHACGPSSTAPSRAWRCPSFRWRHSA